MGEPNPILAEAEPETQKTYSLSQTGKTLLEYETPRNKPRPGDAFDPFFRVGQRTLFAIGAALVAGGVGNGWMGYEQGNVGLMMGWGAALCVLGSPWGWRDPKRKG
jgi:hypothetical protein